MYSIVMLTAMSAGADVTPPPMVSPAPVVGAPVATGCCGAVLAGCYGSSCHGSCYGSSCHGSRHGGFLGLRSGSCHGHSSCQGCSGYSCSGYNCFTSGFSYHGACYGSGYGSGYGFSCTGSAFPFGYSCSGTCHGGSLILYGSTWGPPIGMPPYTLHGYNTGVAPVWGSGAPVVLGNLTDPNAVYGTTTNPNRPPVMTIPVAPPPSKSGSDTSPQGANLKFKLPADAKLFVDGKPAPGTGTDRTFYTPPLAAGEKFFYEVKAELLVDGKLVVEEKRVIVEAGANLTETFPKLIAAASGGPSTVAGK